MGVCERVAEREVHAVPVPARERDRPVVDDADEARLAALVRALRPALLVGRSEEEHVHSLDERAIVVVDPVPHGALGQPIGDPAGVESILEVARLLVVALGHSEMMRVVRPRVHVTETVLDEVTAALASDFELVDGPEGADGILSLLTTTVDGALLDRAGPQLRVVANYAVGVNNIDLAAAAARGVVVANTPDVLTRTTAELAVGLMLALLRRIAEGDRFVRRGDEWEFSLEFMLGASLDGKQLLVVGPGRIGRETARLAEAFGATARFASRADDLRSLLAEADVVSLHVPLTAESRHLIGAAELEAMRPSAVLVNTARGPIVDERALVEALRAGVIAGAALDVFEREPEVEEGLLSLENVVLTPHLGSATRDTRIAMGMLCVEALRAVLLEGRRPANAVG